MSEKTHNPRLMAEIQRGMPVGYFFQTCIGGQGIEKRPLKTKNGEVFRYVVRIESAGQVAEVGVSEDVFPSVLSGSLVACVCRVGSYNGKPQYDAVSFWNQSENDVRDQPNTKTARGAA